MYEKTCWLIKKWIESEMITYLQIYWNLTIAKTKSSAWFRCTSRNGWVQYICHKTFSWLKNVQRYKRNAYYKQNTFQYCSRSMFSLLTNMHRHIKSIQLAPKRSAAPTTPLGPSLPSTSGTNELTTKKKKKKAFCKGSTPVEKALSTNVLGRYTSEAQTSSKFGLIMNLLP